MVPAAAHQHPGHLLLACVAEAAIRQVIGLVSSKPALHVYLL